MAKKQIRDGIRESLEPVRGLLQDLSIERRQWLSTLIVNRSVLRIRLIEGVDVIGVYQSHNDCMIVIANSTGTEAIGFLCIDGIDQMA